MKKRVRNSKDELLQIPGIGPSLADDLRRLGYRCAVYFATAKRHDPQKLKWWNWKD